VRVHTSPEADHLSRELGARAFTTGKDIFGREGALSPHTSEGQKTTAHELTHVEQQSSGLGGGVGRMRVGAVGDAYEQEADSIASSVVGSGLQMQRGQRQEEDEEVALQPERVQRQEAGAEEDEELQTQAEEEEQPEEEEFQMQAEEKEEGEEPPVQLQEEEPEEEEEEPVQTKRETEDMEVVGA